MKKVKVAVEPLGFTSNDIGPRDTIVSEYEWDKDDNAILVKIRLVKDGEVEVS